MPVGTLGELTHLAGQMGRGNRCELVQASTPPFDVGRQLARHRDRCALDSQFRVLCVYEPGETVNLLRLQRHAPEQLDEGASSPNAAWTFLAIDERRRQNRIDEEVAIPYGDSSERCGVRNPPDPDAAILPSLRRTRLGTRGEGHPVCRVRDGGLAVWAGSEAVLPAYIIGMVLAGTVGNDHVLVRRLRTVTFGLAACFIVTTRLRATPVNNYRW